MLGPLRDFFVIPCLFVGPKVAGCAHIAWSWHKRSHAKSEIFSSQALAVITIAASPSVMSRLRISVERVAPALFNAQL